ncbi:MAG: GyrI-like domain-containing protein [Gammaproteobacteria bacterium]|nr:GyrI-like domain-containing protein [Gammaproteobacteria bacterium]
MKKTSEKKAEIKLVGLSLRTNNQNEMDPSLAQIGGLLGTYFAGNIASKIPNRKNPNVTLAVYTEYDSNELGDYTYFLGEEVSSFQDIPAELKTMTLPASQYQKFTTETGPMPKVCIDAWLQIWKMSSEDLGGERAYQADFELYDNRAINPAETSLDIYIGVK